MLTGTGKDDPVTWNFECTGTTGGLNMNYWTTIGVPSNWQLQGFGHYNYGTSFPITEQSNDVGLYQYSFQVPSSWAGQDVQLVFEGVMTDCTVTLNGTSTGDLITLDGTPAGPTHQGGFTQFRYNVTSLLNYGGLNTINCTVAEKSANTSINGAEQEGDYWNFGGIYRPVYLECRPPQSIQRVAINALASGSLSAIVALNNVSAGETLTGSIQTLSGTQVGSSFTTALSAGQTSATLATTASGITTWNPEAPYLYQLVLQLKSGGTLLHTITQQFGFRTVQVIAGQGIYLNGVKIRFKGLAKHTFWPNSGRTSSPALSGSAIAMIQAANVNALRMSHYPPDQHFLDQCDAAGMMILDELPGWQQAYDNATASRMVSEMVPRDVNHPCILLWDNGNEGGWNTTVDGTFADYDPQGRSVVHPGANRLFGSIADYHYPTYANFQTDLAGANIIMATEYQHALFDGGAAAGLADWLAIIEQSQVSAGGFIWSWDDEGVVRTDENGYIDTQGNEAPDGIVGPYWQPEPSYYAVRDIWSPVTVPVSPIASGSTVLSGTFNGQVRVYNDYFFTSLSACSFVWQLEDFPLLSSGSSTGSTIFTSGTLPGPTAAPQTSGTLQIPLPNGWSSHGALQLTAYNPGGRLLTTWTWPIQTQAAMESANLPAASGAATAATSGTAIELSGSATHVYINSTTGLIGSVVVGGSSVSITDGPRLAAGTGAFSSMSVASTGTTQVLTALFTGNLSKIVYTMRGDGWMKVDTTFSLTGAQSYIGVTFNYPEPNVQVLRWFGNGPEPVWQNRLQGVSYSVWTKAPNAEVPGYDWAFEPVFAGFHSALQWASIQTSEQPINIIAETPGLYLRLNTPGNGVTPKSATAAMPPGNLSILEAISAMGDKFLGPSAGNIGPSSAQATGTGTYESVFWMNFGGYNTLGGIADAWTGGGADGNWQTAGNWSGANNPPLAGNYLTFSGAAQLTNTNNFAPYTAFNNLTFTSSAGAYTLAGNAISIDGSLVNNSPNPVNISLGLAGWGSVTQSGAGTLTLSGSNTYTGNTLITSGTLQAVANASNTADGVTSALGQTVIEQSAGTTLSLLGNQNGTVFTPASSLGWANQTTGVYKLFVGNNGSGTGNTLILANVSEANGGITPTYTLTGADGYTLQIGSNSEGDGPISFDDNEDYNSDTPGVTLSIPGGLSPNYNGAFTMPIGGAGNMILGPLVQPEGTIAYVFNSTGIVTLIGANTFTGGATLNAGTLVLDNDTALGAGTFTIEAGATIDSTVPGITQTNNNTQTWAGNFTFAGSDSLNLGAGPVTLTGNVTLTVSANTLAVGGPISGGYALSKAGPGALLLAAANTYSGATSVLNGILEITGTLSGTSSITVNSGGVLYLAGGTISISGAITNNGLFELSGTPTLSQTGSFTNYGVLDLINGPQSLPANFTNHGTVLNSSSVQVQQVAAAGSTFMLSIHGYAQHTYQLQRAASLASPVTWTNIGPPVQGTGSSLILSDPAPAGAQGFYQVLVSP